jgi:hypothetical protein
VVLALPGGILTFRVIAAQSDSSDNGRAQGTHKAGNGKLYGERIMDCPDCGVSNPDGAKFCGSCGNQMQSQAPPTPNGGGSTSSWDNVFKWIGIVVVGLFILGLLSGL